MPQIDRLLKLYVLYLFGAQLVRPQWLW